MEDFDDDALTALIASATLLGADMKAGLYVNVITPNKLMVLADLTEPPYASYVKQSVVMGAPFRDPSNGISSLAGSLHWQQTGTPTPCTIVGIFYASGSPLKLIAVEPFATPISLVDILDGFSTVLEYIQSQQSPGITTVIQ